MIWRTIGKNVNREGTTITYWSGGVNVLVQSRKRHIPHANGEGTWDHTSYFVLKDGEDVAEYWRLSEAKKHAEQLIMEEREE